MTIEWQMSTNNFCVMGFHEVVSERSKSLQDSVLGTPIPLMQHQEVCNLISSVIPFRLIILCWHAESPDAAVFRMHF
jgi:hypothetical protein